MTVDFGKLNNLSFESRQSESSAYSETISNLGNALSEMAQNASDKAGAANQTQGLQAIPQVDNQQQYVPEIASNYNNVSGMNINTTV